MASHEISSTGRSHYKSHGRGRGGSDADIRGTTVALEVGVNVKDFRMVQEETTSMDNRALRKMVENEMAIQMQMQTQMQM